MSLSMRDEFARGWRTLAACSLGNGSGLSGVAFYAFGIFVIPLTEAFGWSTGQVTIGSSFLILGTAFTAPIVGSFIDRFGEGQSLKHLLFDPSTCLDTFLHGI